MCRKPAPAATVPAAIFGLALFTAAGAQALPWGQKEKPAEAPAAAAAQTPAAEAAPARASPEARMAAERMDPLARAAFWARESADPADVEAGVRLAAALRDLERHAEAAQAVQRVLVLHPDNVDALLESARVFIAQGEGFHAIAPVQRVQALNPQDWRAPSLLAVALEQAQRDDEALAAHRQALALAPANPTVLSNAAMFHAGHGDLAQAESLLRRAAADPSAPVQARQNLALVLGLRGRLEEAERLLRQELPPAAVANNLAYLRAVSSGSNGRSWDSLREATAQ